MANNKLGTRTSKNKSKKKANLIYNIILGVVIIAIVLVASSIFLGNDEDNIATEPETNNEQQAEADSNAKEEPKVEEEQAVVEEEDNAEDEIQTEEQAEGEGASLEEETAEDTETSEEEENNSDSAADGNWEPVGTQQTGEHTVNFTKGSVDWMEMEKALAYGAGIDQSDMTVWFLGNGGAPDKATGTISSKSSGTKYKVNIQWVDGQGWKPTSVQQVN